MSQPTTAPGRQVDMDVSGRSPRDDDRWNRVRQALEEHGWDALVCALPSNVLLLSGYWPVIGSAVAIATREGAIAVLAPEDEEALAARGWADVIRPFRPGSLDGITSVLDSVRDPIAALLASQGLQHGTFGVENSAASSPASYASAFVYGPGLPHLLRSALPGASLSDATLCLTRLRSVLTAREVTFVRRACEIARSAFERTAPRLEAGMLESDAAAMLRSSLLVPTGEHRADGFAWCMSGPNAARAYAAFQQTTSRQIQPGDCVLLHCNSYCNGFWTDITRTFWIRPAHDGEAVAEAILIASERARAAVRPGADASTVDRAARELMTSRGFGAAFTHATGHGVGFAAIDHDAIPRIHPRSGDRLEAGMAFNIEPAAYFPGKGGARHCDTVLATNDGAELMTPFQNTADELFIG